MIKIQLLSFFLIILYIFLPKAYGQLIVEEASGIVRDGDELLIVGDEHAGIYYRFDLKGRQGPILKIPRTLPVKEIQGGPLAIDLEAIGILSNGSKVVLSERLHSLIGENGLVVDYDNPMSEFGNRGLEGLAVRNGKNGSSRVAVLWEGGYLERDDIPKTLESYIPNVAFKPYIWVHDLKVDTEGEVIEINMNSKTIEKYNVRQVILKVPKTKIGEPKGQRFRAPGLVWHIVEKGRWGFIVLLSSENATENKEYKHKLLQRFFFNGLPKGKPFDLDTILPNDNFKNANWEGLAWFEPGKSLVLVHDCPPGGTTTAFIVNLPDGW